MSSKSSRARLPLVRSVLALVVVAFVVVIMALFLLSTLHQTAVAVQVQATKLDNNYCQDSGWVQTTEVAVTLLDRNCGVWTYNVSREIDGNWLHATINYEHGSVADLKAYAAANRALLPQVVQYGWTADIAITFVYPVSINWFRAWAKANTLQVWQSQVAMGAPGSGGGGAGIGGLPDDPVPQTTIDNLLGSSVDLDAGILYGTYAKVDTAHLSNLGTDPHVFLVDVTPAYVLHEMHQAGITEVM
jgi:hypothetical protein